MNNEQYLVVVSGPSGVGKDTVAKELVTRYPGVELSVSATTRAMRPGEAEGVNYYYKSVPEFEQLIRDGGILEYTNYCGNYYGTPKKEVEQRMAEGTTVVLVIETEGAANIKKLCPGATTIFICPPSMEELERRLRGRGTEDEATVQRRLARAVEELKLAEQYDEQVINDTPAACAEAIYQLIRARQQ